MAEKQTIRVVIVDDHHMVRRGLASYLTVAEDIQLVGEASDGEEALAVCQEAAPDVVLMDLVMPRMGGVDAIRELKKRQPQVRVVALTSFQEKELVADVLREGAISYILKNVTGDELVNAIRAAQAGRPTLAPEVTQDFILSAREPQVGEDLTAREREVLTLMVEGLSNPDIAERLTVSRATARAHVSNILAKLGVSNRAEAVALALRKRLVR